ncbi:MAG TPA: hypothetical protein VJT13_26800 [Xanthobacteraceae bacterium]|nr:hypothetical protein [Xanthobacteraceae bacterium]
MPIRQPHQQQQHALAPPPPCPGCQRTMRLTSRETIPDNLGTVLTTFSCECGQITRATMK